MEPVHECSIVTHLRWHWPKQVADTLLVFNVNFEVSHHNYAATRPNALSAPAELTGLHIAFHDVNPILLIEGYPGYLIEAHNVILANQAPLSIAVVDKHT